jgi:hypothetical protein
LHPRILFIGEPLKEYVATLEPDDSLSGLTFLGFAGDLAPESRDAPRCLLHDRRPDRRRHRRRPHEQ